jgi:hypothetical protein
MENLLVSESLLFISGWMPSGSEGLWEDGVHPASKITIEAGVGGKEIRAFLDRHGLGIRRDRQSLNED